MSFYQPTPEENDVYHQLFFIASKGGQLDTLGGADAVKFFMSSGVAVSTLKIVWSVASNGQKEMGPREFFTAMRLISLAQNGYTISDTTLSSTAALKVDFPKFQNVEVVLPNSTASAAPAPTTQVSWTISPEARAQFEKLWNTLEKNPHTGLLEGKEAAAFFAKSGQNRDVLRVVWQMSDISGDGMMDLTEFLIGMHLTMVVKKGHALPPSLPAELLASAQSSSSSNPANVSLMGTSASMLFNSSQNFSNSMLGEEPPTMSSSSSRTLLQPPTAPQLSKGGGGNRLVVAIQDATNKFNNDCDKLKQLEEEVKALSNSLELKQSAVSQQQDVIRQRLQELQTLIGGSGGPNSYLGGTGGIL